MKVTFSEKGHNLQVAATTYVWRTKTKSKPGLFLSRNSREKYLSLPSMISNSQVKRLWRGRQ